MRYGLGGIALVGVILMVSGTAAQQATPRAAGHPEAKRAMTLEDFFALKRVADPQISPDGKWVVFVVTTADVAKNSTSSTLWLAAQDGATPPRQLTTTPKKDRHPRWHPDSRHILFESTRSGTSQLWTIAIDGGEPRQVTTLASEANTGIFSRDGQHVAFVSAVYPEFSTKPFAEADAAHKKREDEIEKSPVKAKVFTRLFFRHWDAYVDDKRQHLFVMPWNDGKGGEPRNVTPGDRDAYPTSTTFSVGDDFTFTPDNRHLLFTAVPEKDEAWSTNYDICRVSIDNRSIQWECLTRNNPAADGYPQFSPDGTTLAYRAQRKAGYEADKWNILTVAVKADGSFTGSPSSITDKLNDSVESFVWQSGGPYLIFNIENRGTLELQGVHRGTGECYRIRSGQAHSALSISRDGKTLAHTTSSLLYPPVVETTAIEELTIAGSGSRVKTTSRNYPVGNESLIHQIEVPAYPESVTVPRQDDGGASMQMWVLKPPGFDANKKWPVVYLVHGGPQGAWMDAWNWRWNARLWSNQGYVVVCPNPRGSTGFGQKYTDEICGDWGGKCYRDLVAGLEYVKKLPYVDTNRMASAGGSFGGYMMNWFAANDIAKDFKCLISHCSVYNFESMWGTTDELWFDEYEHGGLPWEYPGKYAEFSPHKKAGNFGKYKVPMLIIHNDLDFRCPIGQGHELFTALQRQGVKSRFVNFPDEGHWVLKPANSQRWHTEVFAWLNEHCPPGGK